MSRISDKIKKTVSKVFSLNETIVVGVSGGADSMTLIHSLLWCDKKFNLIVAHFNHSLRGTDSDNDEMFVKLWCEKNNVKFVSKKLNIAELAKTKKISTELAGRLERYKFFYEFDTTIATAHTLSDKIETMLFNLARGSSLKGLCSIPKTRGKIKRPLINFTRAEIEAYCYENKIDYRTDKTNFNCYYSRNRIRWKIVSEFKKINLNFEKTVAQTLNCLQNDESYFSDFLDKFFKKNFIDSNLFVGDFLTLHISIKTRIVARFLKINDINPNFKLIDRILNLISKRTGRQSLPLNKTIECYNKHLFIKNNDFCESNEKFDFVCSNKFDNIYKKLWLIKANFGQNNYFLNKTFPLFLFKFDYDKIKGLIHIRSRLDGDRIKLKNRPTKKIKCLLQEAKIPKAERSKLIVMADENGPFWLENFGLDVRVIVNEQTKNFVMVFKKPS